MDPATESNARRTLGNLLRRHRIRRGLKGTEAAKILGCSAAQASRIETGQRVATQAHIEALAAAYRLSGEEFAELERLLVQAREAAAPWWAAYGVPAPYARLLDVEASAVRCFDYQTVLIPALLQTPQYASAVNAAGAADLGRGQVDAYTELRMRRQERLFASARPLALEAIITEAALRFVVGGVEAQRAQARHLLHMMERQSNVEVRVVPFGAGENGAQTGAFMLFEMPFGEPEMAFTQSALSMAVITTPLEIRRLRRLFLDLGNTALDPDASHAMIRSLA
ncbi:helix-turn-helix domain-containing protein [Embleya sp. MST-111070]|uniref:helix-turn-helix domain-containing protein n=1 Tax=Embleya sp. MST-111070 TaxID=3398231 RepID=UPI003F734DF5